MTQQHEPRHLRGDGVSPCPVLAVAVARRAQAGTTNTHTASEEER